MEDDSKADDTCKDIARQLIENEPGRKLNVIMGGGLRSFISESPGRRKDGRNLTDEWLEDHNHSEFVTDRYQMMNIEQETEHLLGIFASSHMHFNADRNAELEPSLAEMTKTAIKVLKRKNLNGLLLVVEAGKIDLAHHYNNAFRALDDTLALDEAIEVAVRSFGKVSFYLFQINNFIEMFIVDMSDSMIIVTSDHASAVVYSGFATPKDYSILGMDKFLSNVNKKPYQLLLYSSGLGHDYFNESSATTDYRNSYHQATIPSTWSNHAGDDVPLYAVGSLANILFGGSMDQTYIPHAIAFAMCLFDYKDRCYGHERRVESPYHRNPSKIHMLKQKLQEEFHKKPEVVKADPEILNEAVVEINNFEVPENIFNKTEFDFYSTSDLVSNLTDVDSGHTQKQSSLDLITFLFFFLILIAHV